MLQELFQKYYFAFFGCIIIAIIYLLKKKNIGKKISKLNMSGSSTPNLDIYTIDYTKYIAQGKVDPVIGRKEEVLQLCRVLSRRRKNNALLVGDPGVGKTAIVEGLAQRIIKNDVPDNLRGKRVLALEVANLMAGTKYRGEFEERARKIVSEITNAGRSIILFIDEVHAVVQSHGTEGAINFADILKPALARGELQMIGATTQEEYEKYIKSDLSLERRFQPIWIGEPSLEETLAILKGVKSKYSEYHKVEFTDAALETAVKLSRQLVKDRRLPDKAIDALDEAGAMINLSHLHESISAVLYAVAVEKHPKVAELWKKIQKFDLEIEKCQIAVKKKELRKEVEKLENELAEQGVVTIDSGDIEKVIKEWIT
jgi:ATP-dependent Clp protease ATP-binding subunit ClpC